MKKIITLYCCLVMLTTLHAQIRIKTKPAANTSVDVNVNLNKKTKTTEPDKTENKNQNTPATMATQDTASKPSIQPDETYRGPAKTYVNSFFRELNTVQQRGLGSSSVTNMERALGMIKEKDPAYNTTAMEAEIKTWKEKDAKETAARLAKPNQNQENMDRNRKEAWDKIKLEKLMESVLNIGSFNFRNIETAQAENDAYKAKAQELIGMGDAIATYKADPKTAIQYNRLIDEMKLHYDRTFNTFLERVESVFSTSTGENGGNWKNYYYEMQAEQIHYDAAQKIFPKEPKFAEAYQKITAAINKRGSLETIYARTQVNKIEKIKSTKLPAPVVKDAKLEKIVTDGFNKMYGAKNVSALKAVLTQDGWTTLRNSLTSVITGRQRTAKIAYKSSDGKCFIIVDYVFIYEEYIGSSFVNTKAVFNGLDGQEMLCENVK